MPGFETLALLLFLKYFVIDTGGNWNDIVLARLIVIYNNPSLNGNGTLFSLTHCESIYPPPGLGQRRTTMNFYQVNLIKSKWNHFTELCLFFSERVWYQIVLSIITLTDQYEPCMFHAWGDTSELNYRQRYYILHCF